jgi:hypothetical protein
LNEDQTKAIMVLMILGVGVVGFFSFASLLGFDIGYGGGWEVSTEIWKVRLDGKMYTSTRQPAYTSEWGTGRVHIDDDGTMTDIFGTVLDADYCGSPDIVIVAGNPYHVSYTGREWAADTTNEPYDILTKSFDTDNDGVDDERIVWNHHVYNFEIDVTTDADALHIGAQSYIEARNGFGSFAEIAKVLTKVLFEVNAWQVGPAEIIDGNSTYKRQTGWAGIMSTTVYEVQAYYVTDEPDAYVIDSYAQPGSPLNMWTEEGSRFYPKTGALDQISGVPEAVIIDHYVELLGGFEWPGGGSITPKDVGLLTTVRVDVITSDGYILEAGDQPTVTTRTGIEEGTDPIGDFLTAIAEALIWPFATFADWMSANILNIFMGIIIIIVVIVIVVFLLMSLRARFTRTAVSAAGISALPYQTRRWP